MQVYSQAKELYLFSVIFVSVLHDDILRKSVLHESPMAGCFKAKSIETGVNIFSVQLIFKAFRPLISSMFMELTYRYLNKYLYTCLHVFTVTVVQRLTAWVTGYPVLQLVNKTDTNLAATADLSRREGQRKKQKRLSSQEDEQLYRKLREREGENVERNKSQEEELEKLKQGILLMKSQTTVKLLIF